MNEHIAKNLDKSAIFGSLMIVFVVVKNVYRPDALRQYIIGIGAIIFVMAIARIYSFVKFKNTMVTVFPMANYLPLPKKFLISNINSVNVVKNWISWSVRINLKDGSSVTLTNTRSLEQAERYAADIQAKWELAQQNC